MSKPDKIAIFLIMLFIVGTLGYLVVDAHKEAEAWKQEANEYEQLALQYEQLYLKCKNQ